MPTKHTFNAGAISLDELSNAQLEELARHHDAEAARLMAQAERTRGENSQGVGEEEAASEEHQPLGA